MHELSIFIDESGDFGPYEPHSPFYVLSLVLHEQDSPIDAQIAYLKRHVVEQGFAPDHAIHSGPLIRRECDYRNLDMPARKRLFRAQFSFMRKAPITYRAFVLHKREFGSDRHKMVSRLAREVGAFIRAHLAYFQGFERIIIYYDNGQREITTIVNSVMNALLEADVRDGVVPADYCLFQAADMICTLELLAVKLDDGGLSKSELEFFGGARTLRKNFLRPIRKKRLD